MSMAGQYDVATLYVVRDKVTRDLKIATTDRVDMMREAKRGDIVTEFALPIPRYSMHFGATTEGGSK